MNMVFRILPSFRFSQFSLKGSVFPNNYAEISSGILPMSLNLLALPLKRCAKKSFKLKTFIIIQVTMAIVFFLSWICFYLFLIMLLPLIFMSDYYQKSLIILFNYHI